MHVLIVKYYLAITIGLVTATDLCSFPFGFSCEDIYNNHLESHLRPGYYWTLNDPDRVYCGMNYTGSSCNEIYSTYPETRKKSGYYRVQDKQWAFCNMTEVGLQIHEYLLSTCINDGGNWKRIAKLNITAGDDCPLGWSKGNNENVRFCRIASDDSQVCSSAFFSTKGKGYRNVCGRVMGHQKGGPGGFAGARYFNNSINGSYMDGVSITRGKPHEHIWTYVIGTSDDYNYPFWNCPCASIPGPASPSFVGSNFYCESGDTGTWEANPYYFNDVLWDGSGCTKSHCCHNNVQPWFLHSFEESSSDDIEVRICTVWKYSIGATLVDYVELKVL